MTECTEFDPCDHLLARRRSDESLLSVTTRRARGARRDRGDVASGSGMGLAAKVTCMLHDAMHAVGTPDGPMDVYEVVPEGKTTGAVIVIQEAFGVNEYIRDVTRRFAAAGYYAVAPTMFHRAGGGTAADRRCREAPDPMARSVRGRGRQHSRRRRRTASRDARARGRRGARDRAVSWCAARLPLRLASLVPRGRGHGRLDAHARMAGPPDRDPSPRGRRAWSASRTTRTCWLATALERTSEHPGGRRRRGRAGPRSRGTSSATRPCHAVTRRLTTCPVSRFVPAFKWTAAHPATQPLRAVRLRDRRHAVTSTAGGALAGRDQRPLRSVIPAIPATP
jgi:Dienelactone hydrolase family